MSLELKPYPEYKDSGLPWLGEIPAHWEVKRLKRVARINPSKAEARAILDRGDEVAFLPMDKVGSNGEIDAREVLPAASVWNGFTYFRRGDILLAKITPCFENGKGACLDSLPTSVGFGSTEFIVMRANSRVAPQYLYRVTTLAEFRALGADAMTGSAGQQRVPPEFVRDFASSVPPLTEQEAIVRFLDHADGYVSSLIRAKQRLIELLNEQKRAVIHRAVTRGFDPDAPMKPTGLDWLPEVPEHWELRRVRSLVTSIDQGVSPQAEAILADQYSWGVLKAGCVNGGVFREEEHKRLPNDFSIDRSIAVRVGDVLVSRASGSPRFVGSVGRVRHLSRRLILSDKTFRLNFRKKHIEDFVVAAMNARYFRIQIEQAISGAEGLANNLPLFSLKGFRIALPPATECVAISESLREESKKIDAAIQHARREIDLIREYRTRLISDVVTGKLDVRGVELPEPETDGEGVGAGFGGLESVATVGSPNLEEVQDAALRHQ